MKKLFLIVCCLIAISFNTIQAQLEAEVSIRNGEIINNEVVFDIYIKQSGQTTETINLAFSDFVLKINSEAFMNPVLSKVDNPDPPLGVFQNGYCNFKPTLTDGGAKDWNCQDNYYLGTAVEIVNDYFLINLNSPIATDQSGFENRIAIIDEGTDHRFGRFKISGFINGSVVNIDWETDPNNFVTQIFSYSSTSPFESTRVPVVAIDPMEITEPNAIRENEIWDLTIFPNPTKDNIRLKMNELPENGLTFEIIDAMGRRQNSGEISDADSVISMENLATGIYWLQLKNAEGEQQSHKIVKL